jgi:DivIVA domain-containing protein
MEWILAALVIGIVGLAAAAASGRFGEMPDVVDDRVQPVLPAGSLTGSDLRDVQFAVVPRGYSMEQVDALLARLGSQLDGDRSGQRDVASPGPNNLE